jgi:hypothetical protein
MTLPIFHDAMFWMRLVKSAKFSHRTGGDKYGRGAELHFVIENEDDPLKALRIRVSYISCPEKGSGTGLSFYVPGIFALHIRIFRLKNRISTEDKFILRHDDYDHTHFNEDIRAAGGNNNIYAIYDQEKAEDYIFKLALLQ